MKLLRQMRDDLRLETSLPILIAVIATLAACVVVAVPVVLAIAVAVSMNSPWWFLLAPAQYLLLWWVDGAYKRAYGQDMFEDIFGRHGA